MVLLRSYVQRMTINTRDNHGRASSEYRPEQLYGLVRVIAEEGKPEHPESISIREFDKARVATGHDEAPSAKAICERLVDSDGKTIGWPRIKEVAFDDAASLEHVERRRVAEPMATFISERSVYFALRLIAKRLDVKTLTPGEYEDERVKLIKEERQRDPGRALMAHLVPTVGQIEQVSAGDDDDDDHQGAGSASAWDRALVIAELEPRAQLRDERRQRGRREDSLPLLEAIDLFVQFNDRLPSKQDINEFGEAADVQLEAIRRPWREILKEAIKQRRARGLNEPTEFPKASGGAGGSQRKPKVKAPAAGSLRGVARRLRHGSSRYSRADLVAAIQVYLEQLDGRRRPSQKNYGRYAATNGLPAPSNFNKHGGWSVLLAEARAL